MAIPKQALLIGVGATTVTGGGLGVYYLSQDKTIEHKLTREGEELINDKAQYEVAYLEAKEDTSFKTDTEIAIESKADLGGKALEAWCNKNKDLGLTKDNIEKVLPKVKKYCTKPSTTIEEKYTKLNKKLIATDKWKEKLDSIKTAHQESLKQDLQISNLDAATGNNLPEKTLEKWCNDQKKVKLINDRDNTIWDKLKVRCFQ